MLKVDISDIFSTEQKQIINAAYMLSVQPDMCNFVQLITATKYKQMVTV